jgi:hypothetical protein
MALPTEHRVARLRFGSFMAGLAIFCLFAALAYWGFYQSNPLETYEDKRAKARGEKLTLLYKENHKKLSGYDWVDQKKGVVQIPIDRGIELVLPELKAKPVQASAVKVEHPYPTGLGTFVIAAAGASPAPGATGTAAVTGTGAGAAVSGTSAVSGTAPMPAGAPAKPATTPKSS